MTIRPRVDSPRSAPRHAGYLSAEWRKLRTVPDLALLLAVTVVLTVAASAAAARLAHAPLLGVQVGQAVIAIAGVQVVAGEFGAGLIGVTLLALPRRGRMLTAKALLLTGSAGAAAVVAVLGSLASSRLLAPVLVDGRAVLLSILHLVLIALLGLGIGAAVRNSAAAVGVVLGLLYLMPVLLPMFPDAHWQRLLFRLTPGTAVQALQSSAPGFPLGPWQALGVITLWTTAAVTLGAAALVRRDA